MKHTVIFILMILACMRGYAQSSEQHSAEMKELMKIIEMQKKIKSSQQKDGIYDGIRVRKGQSPYGEIMFTFEK